MDFSGKRPVIIDADDRRGRSPSSCSSACSARAATCTPRRVRPRICRRGSPPTCGWWSSSAARPAIFVPDNLRSGVTQACRYEPVINRTYLEFAQHYGAAVVPARAGHPRDKAVVEASVLVAQRWILAALRHRRFFSLAELNAAIWELLPALNARPMQQARRLPPRSSSSSSTARCCVRCRPTRYEFAEWRDAGVNIDYHVVVEHNYYSVPYQLVHQRVEVRLTATTVEIFLKGRRIASHRRRRGRGQYATDPAHMPARPSRPCRVDALAPDRLGGDDGPGHRRSSSPPSSPRKPHPEQGYRACLGLMRLGKTLRRRAPGGGLRARPPARRPQLPHRRRTSWPAALDRVPLADGPAPSPALPVHPNIRGRAYYTREETAMLAHATIDKLTALRLPGHGRGLPAPARQSRVRRPQLRGSRRPARRCRVDRTANSASSGAACGTPTSAARPSLEDIDWHSPRRGPRQGPRPLPRHLRLDRRSIATCS